MFTDDPNSYQKLKNLFLYEMLNLSAVFIKGVIPKWSRLLAVSFALAFLSQQKAKKF